MPTDLSPEKIVIESGREKVTVAVTVTAKEREQICALFVKCRVQGMYM